LVVLLLASFPAGLFVSGAA